MHPRRHAARHRRTPLFWLLVALCAGLGAGVSWLALRLLVMWITLD